MQLKIISWNIRHFREAKINDYVDTLWGVCCWADVVFIYEDHSGLGKTLAEKFNTHETNKWGKQTFHWLGMSIRTLDEYVAVIWRSPLRVERNTSAESQFSALLSGERCPVVVDIQREAATKVTIAAWHAYGPAKVSAKDLFQTIQHTGYCDILIGDFNFQSFDDASQPGTKSVTDSQFELPESMDFEVKQSMQEVNVAPDCRRSLRIQNMQTMQEVLPSNHRGATTFTKEGAGHRTTGLDRCLVNKRYIGAVKLEVASPTNYVQMSELTDHMPLMLVVEHQ